MKKEKVVLLIAPYAGFPGGGKGLNRFKYIAEKLAARGLKIIFVNSNFSHTDKKHRIPPNNIPQNIKVVPLEELGYKKNISLKRVFSHKIFEKNLKKYLLFNDLDVDVVYSAFPPLGAAYQAGEFAKRNKIPFILDIQDLWPEAFIGLLPRKIGNLLFYPLGKKADKVFSMADYVIAVSNTFLKRAKRVSNAKGFLCVYIGTELDMFTDQKIIDLEKKSNEFRIIYVGSISYSYDLSTCIRMMKLLKEYPNIKMQILGDGPNKKQLEDLSIQEGVNNNVDFFGFLPYKKMIDHLINSDVAISPIVKSSKSSVTNKIGVYIAAGLPIVNCSPNEELKSLIKDNNIGLNYSSGDIYSLKKCIEFLYKNPKKRNKISENTKEIAERFFDRKHSYEKIFRLIEHC